MRVAISIEIKVVMSLYRLDTRNGLLLIVEELFGIAKSKTSYSATEFCKTIRKHLQMVLIQFPSELQLSLGF